MTRDPILRGGRPSAAGGKDDDHGVLRGFVDFLRSGIDRYGDYQVEVRVAVDGRRSRRDLPVAAVECNHGSERVCLRTPGLLRGGGGEGLLLRDLLNQLSTAVAQGPDYALALSDGDVPGDEDGDAGKRREMAVDGLQVKPHPARRALSFVVTVAD